MTTSPPRSHRTPNPHDPPSNSSSSPAVVIAVKRIFGSENIDYFVVIGATLFLVIFGLVMVLSSSSVPLLSANGDPFTGFLRQAMFALLGIPVMFVASRLPPSFWKKWAGLAVLVSLVLQLLVVTTGLGIDRNGNRNWIRLGDSLSFQPSELIKVALVVWLGLMLAKRIELLDDWRNLIRPIGLVCAIAIGLVLFGGDLGTAIILVAIVFGALFFAGVKLRHLLVPALVMAGAVVFMTMSGGSRQDRIHAWQSGCLTDGDYHGLCWQTLHGWWALASGGLFGVGLGNSKAKWSWLPEADNDFIFAIIGEELGLLGAIVVLALFVVLAISFIRIIRRSNDPAAKITVSAVLVWILSQAFVNIAVVLGLLPVLGVPLPLISAGGSALVTSLLAIGIVLSYARAPRDVQAVR